MSLDLDAIEKVCEAAMPGPWQAIDNGFGDVCITPSDVENGFTALPCGCAAEADFIANARSWVPALVARVRQQEDELKTLRERSYESELSKEMIRAVRAEEREECATILDTEAARYRINHQGHSEAVCLECAAAIRARGR